MDALRIAARFFDRSADTKVFKRGIDVQIPMIADTDSD
jgi:hypothetical protein